VSFCLSKGLGAPVGSLLCGPRDLLERARRFRKAFGGALRQVGILGAAGLYALEHNVARLADDHRRARTLYEGLRAAGLDASEPETNMVYVAIPGAPDTARRLAEKGVLCVAVGPTAIRLVTHLDVDDDGIAHAIAAFAGMR
jgi:threonine aldolase